MSANDGGPAFPQNGSLQIGEMSYQGSTGITMRDYFAAKAMQQLVLSVFKQEHVDGIVSASYIIADAMLKARES